MKPHVKQPTPEDIAAILAPSSEDPVLVELHKPAYDYLFKNLKSDILVSEYVSNRITAELVRLSKLRSPNANLTTEARSRAMRTRWDEWHRTHKPKPRGVDCPSVRVRAYDGAYRAFVALDGNSRRRVSLCGDAVLASVSSHDASALLGYCESHKGKPAKFITVPKDAAEKARAIASSVGVPFTKFVSFALER